MWGVGAEVSWRSALRGLVILVNHNVPTPPGFSVSVASKAVREAVSLLFATLIDTPTRAIIYFKVSYIISLASADSNQLRLQSHTMKRGTTHGGEGLPKPDSQREILRKDCRNE